MCFVCENMGIWMQYLQSPGEGIGLMDWKLTELSDMDAGKQLILSTKEAGAFNC